MATTLSVFDWLEASGLLTGEVKRLHTAFMFEHGVWAKRWLDQADPPPSWKQMADLLSELQRAEQERDKARQRVEEARDHLENAHRLLASAMHKGTMVVRPEIAEDLVRGAKNNVYLARSILSDLDEGKA